MRGRWGADLAHPRATAPTPPPSRSGTATCWRRRAAEAEAFINIRYDDAQASIDDVVAGATGDFQEQYTSRTDDVIELLQQNKSVMDGKVLWAGVVDVDKDSATVLAATTGTVANTLDRRTSRSSATSVSSSSSSTKTASG